MTVLEKMNIEIKTKVFKNTKVSKILDFDDVIRIIDEATEECNNGWIPCSEQMPKEHESIFAKHKGTDNWCDGMFEKYSDDVNVTIEFEDEERMTMTLHTIDGKWPCDLSKFKKSYRVIAWQPLPQPYKLKECLFRKRKLSINLEDVIQIIIDNLDTVEMKSYLNIDKLLEALMVKAKETSMVDLEAIAAKIREEVAKLDKKQTNYERIISMSLEELAFFIADIREPDEDMIQIRISAGTEYEEFFSEDEIRQWLSKES